MKDTLIRNRGRCDWEQSYLPPAFAEPPEKIPGKYWLGTNVLTLTERRGMIGNVLSESLLHLPLWLIFRHMHRGLINVRSTYAS